MRIFFFPLLLLQFGFYAFIIDGDFGLGLIKGSDFGRRKQNFWVERMVILASFSASFSFFLSSSSPSSFFNFQIDYLYEFVYVFDEFLYGFDEYGCVVDFLGLIWMYC